MAKNKFGRRGWTPKRIGSLEGKTYLITGTTNGTGFEAARIFLSKGAKVVMLNRSAERSEATISTLKKEFGKNADVSFIKIDLGVLDSVRQAGADIMQTVPRIDALICNAAIAQIAKQELTVDGFESQLGVNHLGHFLLSGLVHERIEESGGRMVMVGSLAYKMGAKEIQFDDLNFDENYTAWEAYAQSKLAQMMFGYELQRRFAAAGKNVVAQVCHPGASRTNLINDSASLSNRILWSIMAPMIAQSAERGAWPEVMCATEKDVESQKLYGPTKRAETVGPVGAGQLDECALDSNAAGRLWKVSEEMTSLSWSP